MPTPVTPLVPSSATPKTVRVDLNVTIDANSAISIFGQEFQAPGGEVIIPTYQLPVSALYEATGKTVNKALLMFWEPTDDIGSTKVALADEDFSNVTVDGVVYEGYNMTNASKKSAQALGQEIQKMLCSEFDCSGTTSPFREYYPNQPKFYKYNNFARVALSAIAKDILGHPSGTVAITNDQEFCEKMLSLESGADVVKDESEANRYAKWKYNAPLSNVPADWITDTTNDSNIARRLVNLILSKTPGRINKDGTADKDTLAYIASQVLFQDVSRAMGEDNNESFPYQKVPLKFYAGDELYFNIKVKAPTVNVGSGQKELTGANANKKEHNYVITIALKDDSAPTPVPTSFYTGNVVPFTITEIDVPTHYLTISSNGTYTGDASIQVIKNGNLSAEHGFNINTNIQFLNETGIFTADSSAAIPGAIPGNYFQLYRLYYADGVTRLTTPVPLSNVFTIPAVITIVSGTPGSNMTFKFTPNMNVTVAFASTSNDGGNSYTQLGSPFSVTNGIEYTYTGSIPEDATNVRFTKGANIIAEPVRVLKPEDPSNVTYSGNTLTFNLPRTIAQLDFVDIDIGGILYRGYADQTSENPLTINGSTVSLELPFALSGTVHIYTRYDTYSGRPDGGYYELVIESPVSPVSPVAATSVTYDSANQRLVLTYADNSTANAITHIDFDLNVNDTWIGFTNSAPYTVSGNVVYVTGITQEPTDATIIVFFNGSQVPNDTTYNLGSAPTYSFVINSSSNGIITYNGTYTGLEDVGIAGTDNADLPVGTGGYNGWEYLGGAGDLVYNGDNLTYDMNLLQRYAYYRFIENASGEAPLSDRFSVVFTIPPAPPSNPINITSVNTSSRQIEWIVQSVPSGHYEFQYSTDGTTWNLACGIGYPRLSGTQLSGLNDIPADTSVLMSLNNANEYAINANYFSGLVNGVATYVSVPSNLSGVQFRAVLSNPDTWYQTGPFNKPTPKSPIEVVSNVFTVE